MLALLWQASRNMEPMTPRQDAIRGLAKIVSAHNSGHPLRVAVDGRTASGKTTLADELASQLRQMGREVIRASLDGFHRPRAERYARGRQSPEGYYYDARDISAIRRCLLDPLGPGGDRRYRTQTFDLENDVPVDQATILAPSGSILMVDGTFLQRPELADAWDLKIFVRVDDQTALTRGLARDSAALDGEENARNLYTSRYLPAYDLYCRESHPEDGADVVFDNEDFEHPFVVGGAPLKERPR